MPSPFPGMNPYLEHAHVWHDFQKQFRSECRTAIVKSLQPKYYGLIGRENSIEIFDSESRQLTTVISMIRPEYKSSGKPREEYQGWRSDLLSSHVNLVELDLLRGGCRLHDFKIPASDYQCVLLRGNNNGQAAIWPFGLRDRLPVISVPLRESAADVPLDLQAALHAAYDHAFYGDYIYRSSPEPSLSAEDQAWANELIKSA